MILESIGASMLLVGAIRTSNMSDQKKIEKIFEYTKTWIKTEQGNTKKCQFIRKAPISDVGTEYVYRLPLGMPFKKLEYLNENVGVFKDGLHKNVELDWDGGMLHVNVYETDLPRSWPYRFENKNGWKVPIGKTYKEVVWHDFDEVPHLVGGGTTRYGKTNLMKVIMTDLIKNHPQDVELYLIDLKAGVEFSKYQKLEQVKKVATNIEQTYDLLNEVCTRLEIKQAQAREQGWSNIIDTKDNSRIFIIVDEAGDIPDEGFMDSNERKTRKECQWMLSHIARIGGAFGFRELFFSQYTTADVLPRQIKQNADSKICFKIQNGYASEVILGEKNTQAADLPKIKGRAIYKDGPDLIELQVPYISDRLMNYYLKEYEGGADEPASNGDTDLAIEFRDVD
ncbi:FtsK/SpoIIIE domain-containing protein [Terrihalobacillus insolitus]|uniref:FtsK/SpoIIIE domain-containing protein n=1 Tax=Terrihalobacillus insolitus TaxID=2950438 RepID=UPI0023404668|nr:FtsK/SpoIIIE domain-containing protein [Terrihalobacillus insolitus]MDC3414248.1 FtsK/SpoIIIE domain-containing protein [Terrihalobacillus insolitus]